MYHVFTVCMCVHAECDGSCFVQVDVWSVGVIFYQCLYGKKVCSALNVI